MILFAREALNPSLPDDLCARIEERVYVENAAGDRRSRSPDVFVTQLASADWQSSQPTAVLRESDSDAALAEPHIFEYFEQDHTEGVLEIRERGGGHLVTAIELLSPGNKAGTAGTRKYLRKQAEVLRSHANLVEIDLIRGGRHVLAIAKERLGPELRKQMLACITPAGRARHEVYAISLRQRLPVLPIPLRAGEPPVRLDLQALADRAYAGGRYHTLDYTLNPDPPLGAEDTAWARALLAAH